MARALRAVRPELNGVEAGALKRLPIRATRERPPDQYQHQVFGVKLPPTAAPLVFAHQPLAESVHEHPIGRRQSVNEAIDGLDDDPPLRESRDGAERVEARLEFVRQPHAELRIVPNLLSSLGAGRRPARSTTNRRAIVVHNSKASTHG
jgi:hypothetical protein